MDLKPSTYYLDRIKSFSSELAESQAQQQKATLEQQQQAEKASKAVAEAEQKKTDERTAFVKQLYSQGFGETMWGQHRSIVSQMRNGINENLDAYVSNPDQFYRDLGQLRSFIEASEDYYRRTSKSAQEAFVRTTPGTINPYESEGAVDGKTKEKYEEALKSINEDSAVVDFSPGSITINGNTIEQYAGMFTGDPFLPELKPLPEYTPQEVYLYNSAAFMAKPEDQWDVVANRIVNEILEKKPKRMIGDVDANQTDVATQSQMQAAAEKMVSGLIEEARKNKAGN